MALSWRISLGVLALLVVGLLAAPGYEQRAAGQEKTGGGSASGGGKEKTGGDSEFQGVTDSYGVAQEEIEAEGGEQEAGEYRVGYIVEPAEGWWDGDPTVLQWRGPSGGETNHIEILPFEAESGLLVPGMQINLTILDESGKEIESKPLEFYRGEFYHYANNFSLPESGAYTLKAELNPPSFRRHETEENEGKVFTEAVTTEFDNVEINIEGE
ncbi:MAG: iron transporter [Actinomycetota bacterium]|nr:iron transporter [Actinomycetota bacterium]